MKKMHLSILKEVFRMSQILENPRGGCVLAGINSVLGALDKVCPILDRCRVSHMVVYNATGNIYLFEGI